MIKVSSHLNIRPTVHFAFDMSRVVFHFRNKRFAIISSFRHGLPKKETYAREASLKAGVRALGLGYREIKGVWREGDDGESSEYPLFIPNINPTNAIALGKKYGQQAIIYGDGKRVILHFNTGSPNKVFDSIQTTADKPDLSDPAIAAAWREYSQIRGQRFKFSAVAWDFDMVAIPQTFMGALASNTMLSDCVDYPRNLKVPYPIIP